MRLFVFEAGEADQPAAVSAECESPYKLSKQASMAGLAPAETSADIAVQSSSH